MNEPDNIPAFVWPALAIVGAIVIVGLGLWMLNAIGNGPGLSPGG